MHGRAAMFSAIGVGIALALTLSGCMGGYGMPGGTSSQGSSAQPIESFNQADVHFNMMMIPHHEQAIEMSDIILSADGISPETAALAQQIKDAQAPEITQMTTWLEDRGYPASSGMSDMPGMQGGDGMLSDDDLDELRTLTGEDAERTFLLQMIEHHEGAIQMAEDEIATGEDADTISLCRSIVTSQTAEIMVMRQLLAEI